MLLQAATHSFQHLHHQQQWLHLSSLSLLQIQGGEAEKPFRPVENAPGPVPLSKFFLEPVDFVEFYVSAQLKMDSSINQTNDDPLHVIWSGGRHLVSGASPAMTPLGQGTH